MPVDDRVLAAAENNARWCDVVSRSHGVATTFEPSYWLAHQRSPKFYPDLVTLQPAADLDPAWARLDESGGCSVKDSFADQDLTGRGFHVLFEAQWIRWEPSTEHRPSTAAWSVVADSAGLVQWGAAHAAGAGDPGILRPALL